MTGWRVNGSRLKGCLTGLSSPVSISWRITSVYPRAPSCKEKASRLDRTTCFSNSRTSTGTSSATSSHNGASTVSALTPGKSEASTSSVTAAHAPGAEDEVCELGSSSTSSVGHLTPFLMTISVAVGFRTRMVTSSVLFGSNVPAMTSPNGRTCGRVAQDVVGVSVDRTAYVSTSDSEYTGTRVSRDTTIFRQRPLLG